MVVVLWVMAVSSLEMDTSGTGRIYFADNSVVILADKEVRSIIITIAITDVYKQVVKDFV